MRVDPLYAPLLFPSAQEFDTTLLFLLAQESTRKEKIPLMSRRSALSPTRRLAFLGALLLPAVLLGAMSLAQSDQKPETSGKKYKNIKVLKNLPADQLIPMMHEFNRSLDVKCDFCHVVNAERNAWDKDDKPEKQKAREMILITNDLNEHHKAIDKQATCYMCHHGHPEPETKAPEATPPSK